VSLEYSLPVDLDAKVRAKVEEWTEKGNVARLWAKDPTLWTNTGEENWLGWLDIVDQQVDAVAGLQQLAEDVKTRGFEHMLLLGMGGSSLCPEVLKMTFGKRAGFPEVHVLDSTDPAQVKTFEQKVNLEKTLVFVSSKSGSTLEPNIFKQYFFDRVGNASQFIAITDPGSNMQKVAEADGFWKILYGVKSIGGRYSALSNFGMGPAAAMGLDVARFLHEAQIMVGECHAEPAVNPGVALGIVLGTACNAGRDKLTIVASPGLYDLGAWLEQLVAESTGKIGKGIVPVDREPLAPPHLYGNDRVFVYIRLEGGEEKAHETGIAALEAAGHPVIKITVPATYRLGAEFFRWEIATAVAGAVIGINPFDQPDVEASKIATKKLTSEFEATGSLPAEEPLLITDPALTDRLKDLLATIQAGDYFAVLGYVEMNEANEVALQSIRAMVRDSKKIATCLGFGPRFLHSTGQAYKGGPNSGVFLQVTCDDAADLPVPGNTYSFGIVKAAQARGDLEVLVERKRRCLRVHLGADVRTGLAKLRGAITKALYR
jgi:transaldolase / glucose-6-phosphate isomerase